MFSLNKPPAQAGFGAGTSSMFGQQAANASVSVLQSADVYFASIKLLMRAPSSNSNRPNNNSLVRCLSHKQTGPFNSATLYGSPEAKPTVRLFPHPTAQPLAFRLQNLEQTPLTCFTLRHEQSRSRFPSK